jgi:hypothetical protein
MLEQTKVSVDYINFIQHFFLENFFKFCDFFFCKFCFINVMIFQEIDWFTKNLRKVIAKIRKLLSFVTLFYPQKGVKTYYHEEDDPSSNKYEPEFNPGKTI